VKTMIMAVKFFIVGTRDACCFKDKFLHVDWDSVEIGCDLIVDLFFTMPLCVHVYDRSYRDRCSVYSESGEIRTPCQIRFILQYVIAVQDFYATVCESGIRCHSMW
jgi:hypothetical protein